ncbi:MAG TPA: SdrD B-like domain-containing protein [Terriglobales bacterium]|nr:SdrD B-like domain-containing protein [Terriglobales bacterium]
MSLRRSQFALLRVAVGLVLSFFVLVLTAVPSYAQATNSLPPLIEVYWNSNRSVAVEGASNVVVLDPDIAEVNVTPERIDVVGVSRGETVVLLTLDGKQMSTRVRVVARPAIPVDPNLMLRAQEMAHGSISSEVQIANNGSSGSSVSILNAFGWSQNLGENRRFDFSSQFESNSVVQSHAFNIRRAAALYTGPRVDIHAFDFDVSLTGGPQDYASQFSFNDTADLRGVSVTFKGEKNRYSFFGGTTIPYYYLVLGSTRDVAGFSFQRKQTDNLLLYANSTYVNAPVDVFGLQSGRINNFMQTAGLAYRLRNTWYMRATGGVSNHGGLGQGEVDYTGHRMTAFAAASTSSSMFPLNQLQSLFSGTSYIKTGWMFRNSDWMGESLFYEHSITKAAASVVSGGSSDYLTPGFWLRFMKGQDINFNYTYSRQTGGFLSGGSTGNRFDVNLHSQFAHGVSNAAQVSVGSLQDPLQLNSEDRFMFNDSLVMPVKGGSLMFGFQHSRTNPSLVSRVNSELSLLSPALQELFLKDPVSFVESNNLPPEIRALVEASQPVSTGMTAAGDFRIREKLMLSPMFSFARTSNGSAQSWSPFFGYGLGYQIRPTVQFHSNMTNVWVVNSGNFKAQRTTVFSFGVTKTFSMMPLSLTPIHHGHSIEGQVFRDNNINGVLNADEPGLAGIQVRLDNGETTMTDRNGHFRFHGVSTGLHQVSVSLDQFHDPVRMTTPNMFEADLIREKQAVASFGIINFARVMGNVFNDLRFHNMREPDAKGLPEIKMVLANDHWKRNFISDGTGDFEIDDVPPGQYTLTVDTTSIPSNYSLLNSTFPVTVTPVSTVVQDVPVRALRSIAGTVYLQVGENGQSGKPKLVPMANVQITAGYGVATTDKNGEFLLRELPAGNLTITLVPLQPLPEGLKVPSGRVRMPEDPVQVQGATIVISSPELVKYLVGKTARQVQEEGTAAVAARR